MAVELFANTPSTTVTSGGTDAPASGTQETWTVASSAQFPAAASPASQFHAGDPQFPSEVIAVTNVSGTTWTVTRGAEGTIPVQHAAGFTVWQVTSAGILGIFAQTGAGDLGGTGDDPEVTGTHLTNPLPTTQGGTGLNAGSASALLAGLGALQAADNLSDVGSASAALANIGGAPLGAAATSAVPVSTTAETVVASVTMPAGLPAGASYRITAWGSISIGGTGGTFVSKLRVGGLSGTQVASASSGSFSSSGTGFWSIDATATLQAPGLAGLWTGFDRQEESVSGTNSNSVGAGTVTASSLAPEVLAVTVALSSSTSSAPCLGSVAERIA